MTVAVLSGKGGTGKTFVSVNLAAAAGQATYVDCDAEEPNGRLFLQPENVRSSTVCTPLPEFDAARCDGCRACVDFCRFHALVLLHGRPRVFEQVCHACGGCALVCPNGAVRERERPVGVVETGSCGGVTVVTGVLNPGEASAVPVIRAALRAGRDNGGGLTVLDCPPGSSCAVMECICQADRCILVAEPTAFGLHNLRMVHTLARLLEKPCGVVINRAERPWQPLEDFCAEHDLPVLARIPFDPHVAALAADGALACRHDGQTAERFAQLLGQIRREADG